MLLWHHISVSLLVYDESLDTSHKILEPNLILTFVKQIQHRDRIEGVDFLQYMKLNSNLIAEIYYGH